MNENEAGIFTPVAPLFTYAEGWLPGVSETIIVGPNGVQNGEVPSMEQALLTLENGAVVPAAAPVPVVQQAGILGRISWPWVIGGLIGGAVLYKLYRG